MSIRVAAQSRYLQHRAEQDSKNSQGNTPDSEKNDCNRSQRIHPISQLSLKEHHYQIQRPLAEKTTMPDPNFLQGGLAAISDSLTPTILTTLSLLTLLYFLTLSPHPKTPSFSLDYTLHIISFLFPPLSYIYSFLLSYILCLLAVGHPLSTITPTPLVIGVWYTLFYILTALNTRLGNGARRPLIWGEQIAVITGGAGGLGWLIAKILELKGVTVVVWDIKCPEDEEEEEGGVKWYKVDVGNAEEVEKAYKRVVDDVRSRLFFSLHYFTFSLTVIPILWNTLKRV